MHRGEENLRTTIVSHWFSLCFLWKLSQFLGTQSLEFKYMGIQIYGKFSLPQQIFLHPLL